MPGSFFLASLASPVGAAAARARCSSAFVRNLGALGAAQIAMRVSRLLTTVALSRLLLPADYGLAAIVLTVYEIVALFTRNGISAKVAQVGDAELDGVRVFTPQGEAIGHIDLPERCANVCFGGRHRNRLFMAASHGLYALYVNTQGAKGG